MVAANSSPTALLINTKTDAIGWSHLPEQDCWALSREIACPSRIIGLEDLMRTATILTAGGLDEVAKSSGVSIRALLSEFTSEGGKALALEPTKEKAAEYLDWAKGKYVPLVEYWLASGIAADRRAACRPEGRPRESGAEDWQLVCR